ncbi:hypothetical protein ACFRDV_32810 [Streptomyces fagopyri]|uniref:hypothetical protein n=1 Tax=Streptomyces fagopyri TaxID=2662397 RepID=UPI00368820EA
MIPSGGSGKPKVLGFRPEKRRAPTTDKAAQHTALREDALSRQAKVTGQTGLLSGPEWQTLDISRVSAMADTLISGRGLNPYGTVKDSPGRGAWRSLLVMTIATAAKSDTDLYTTDDVEAAFNALLEKADALATESADATAGLRNDMNRPEDQTLRAKVAQIKAAQEAHLKDATATLDKAEIVAIFRGTKPIQARAIYDNQSMGGAVADPQKRHPPTEGQASAQTGTNNKGSGRDKVEEWSLDPLRGFASGGFMMCALVAGPSVRMPPSMGNLRIGERGVTGLATLPVEATVWEVGAPLIKDSVTQKIEMLRDNVSVEDYLKRALPR